MFYNDELISLASSKDVFIEVHKVCLILHICYGLSELQLDICNLMVRIEYQFSNEMFKLLG